MGWLGGLGKGMVQYGDIMQKQKEMDWKSQEASLANERKMNLEKLRMSNQNKMAEKSHEYGLERIGEQDRLARERQSEQNEYTSEEKDADRKFKADQKVQDAQAALDLLEKKTIMLKDLEQKDRDKVADDYKEIAMADGVWDTEDELRDFAMRSGTDLKGLLKSDKPMSAEFLKEINEMFAMDEEFAELPLPQKISKVQQAYRALSGRGSSPQSQGEDGSTTVDVNQVQRMRESVNDGTLDVDEMLQTTKGTPYEKYAIEIAKSATFGGVSSGAHPSKEREARERAVPVAASEEDVAPNRIGTGMSIDNVGGAFRKFQNWSKGRGLK